MTTASARGRANRNKGALYERKLAAWLREHGWPDARRGRDNGSASTPDGYDIIGTLGLLWDVKSTTDRPWLIPDWLDRVATDAVRRHEFGVLVVKRAGHTDPGRWWAWMRVGDFADMCGGEADSPAPMCMELGELAPLLHAAGYGQEES